MIPSHLEKLRTTILTELQEKSILSYEHAEHFATKQSGEVVELNEDEMRMLKAYRAFKSRSYPNTKFIWFTPKEKEIVLIPESPSLIIDTREVELIQQ